MIMKKIAIIVFVIITLLALGYALFIQEFELFPDERIELVKFNENGSVYKVYSFKGNATVSSNIQLYKNNVILGVSNSVGFYTRGEIIRRNDSTICLMLRNEENNGDDTLRIKFTEPVSFK